MNSVGSATAGTGASSVGYLKLSAKRTTVATTQAPVATGPSLHDLLARLSSFRNSLSAWQEATRFGRRGQGRSVAAEPALSSSTLSLAGTATAATLVSTEEINGEPANTFSPASTSFSGTSTSVASLGGVYDGGRGTTTLTVKVKNGGDVGVDNVVLDVFDGAQKIQTIAYNGSADSEIALANGLTIRLSAGTAVKDDTFTIDLAANANLTVDPNVAFDGSGGDPGFESTFSIATGNFDVNGTSIAVASTDTLNEVLQRINSSSAGVTASFDAATDSVNLIQNSVGPAPTINLANDTSGLLAALKLDAAVVSPGTNGGMDQPIDQVASLSSIGSGNLRVNGVEILIDVSVDSLADVLRRIENSAAGVSATYDAAQDRVRIQSDDPEADLVLEDGASGFFSGVEIAPGTFAGETTGTERRMALRDRRRFEQSLERVGRALIDLFEGEYQGLGAGRAARVKSRVKGAIFGAFSSNLDASAAARFESDLGIAFDFEAENGDSILQFDEEEFRRALRSSPETVARMLVGSRSTNSNGLVGELSDAARILESELLSELQNSGSVGNAFDQYG